MTSSETYNISEVLDLPLPNIRALTSWSVMFDLDGTCSGYVTRLKGCYRMGAVVDLGDGLHWHGAGKLWFDADDALHVFAIAQHLLQLYPPKEERADHP